MNLPFALTFRKYFFPFSHYFSMITFVLSRDEVHNTYKIIASFSVFVEIDNNHETATPE